MKLRAAHRAALGGVNFSCLRSALGKLAGLPTMACEGLPIWEQQVCVAGVGWQLGHQTEHPHLARGAISIRNILHLVTKPGRPGGLGREEVVRGGVSLSSVS